MAERTLPRALLLASLLLLVPLAGCAEAPEDARPSAAPPSVSIVPERPAPSFKEVRTGPAALPDANATTAAAPRLVRGEWWKIRFESSFLDESPEFLRVVADATAEGYVIGMPHEGWLKEAIAFHAPAFGDVGLDLSYAVHDERFEPLRFPLVEGATWTTRFGATPLTATVERADASKATVRFDPPPSEPQPTDPLFALLNPLGSVGGMRLVYDAERHEVVEFESFIGRWKVLAHGYDFEGWVTVPRGLRTAIDYGQFLPATPGEPIVARAATIEGDFNRMTLLHGIAALGPGAYRVRSVAPDGTEFATESVGTRGFTVKFHEASDPDGVWNLEDIVGGPGGTYTMGMAYHQYDIRLPDGARRSDHDHPVVR